MSEDAYILIILKAFLLNRRCYPILKKIKKLPPQWHISVPLIVAETVFKRRSNTFYHGTQIAGGGIPSASSLMEGIVPKGRGAF